jgi:nickel-dependent lactate racemase
MREIEMPFGEKFLNIPIPDQAIVTEVIDQPAIKSPERYTREVLEAPLGCQRLSKIASKGDRVAIVVPDVTRPGNFRSVAIKGVLEELHRAGVQDKNIFIINGVGSHRKNTEAELEKMLSSEIFHAYPVFTHDHKDDRNLIELGSSSLGDPVIINRKVAEADIIIDIGLVHPQPSAGYSSGGKKFSVGVAGSKTIAATHRSFDPAGIWGSTSRMGVWKGNKFRDRHESIGLAVQEKTKAGVIFTVNCVINSRNELIGMFAGEMIATFRAAAELADKQWKVNIPRRADLVICAAGHPYDKDVYQLGVAACSLERAPIPVVKEGGVILFIGPMGELPPPGSTEEYVARLLSESYGPEDVIQVARDFDERGEVPPLGLQRAFSNCLFEKLVHGNLFLAGASLPGFARSSHWEPTRTFEEAFQSAQDIVGKKADVVVAPRVRSTIVNVMEG